MKKLKLIIPVLILLCMNLPVLAQNGNVEMADTMRSNGRIYVVIAVILTILIGLVLYMIRLDRKITRLEKEK